MHKNMIGACLTQVRDNEVVIHNFESEELSRAFLSTKARFCKSESEIKLTLLKAFCTLTTRFQVTFSRCTASYVGASLL